MSGGGRSLHKEDWLTIAALAGAGAVAAPALLGMGAAGAAGGAAAAGEGLLAGGLGSGAAGELAGAGLLTSAAPTGSALSIGAGNAVTALGGDYLGMMGGLDAAGGGLGKLGRGMQLAQMVGGQEAPPPPPGQMPGQVIPPGASAPSMAETYPAEVIDEEKRRRMMRYGR